MAQRRFKKREEYVNALVRECGQTDIIKIEEIHPIPPPVSSVTRNPNELSREEFIEQCTQRIIDKIIGNLNIKKDDVTTSELIRNSKFGTERSFLVSITTLGGATLTYTGPWDKLYDYSLMKAFSEIE